MPCDLLRAGQYLHRRRTVAGLSLAEAARDLAMVPSAIGHSDELGKLEARLERAESDVEPLSLHQAALLRNVYPFDVGVYDQLLDLDAADEVTRRTLPVPQLCRTCACSWHDPCFYTPAASTELLAADVRPVFAEEVPCAWSDSDPALCTRCEELANREATAPPLDVPQAPILQPQGTC